MVRNVLTFDRNARVMFLCKQYYRNINRFYEVRIRVTLAFTEGSMEI